MLVRARGSSHRASVAARDVGGSRAALTLRASRCRDWEVKVVERRRKKNMEGLPPKKDAAVRVGVVEDVGQLHWTANKVGVAEMLLEPVSG